MELIYQDNSIVVCVKPARVLSTDEVCILLGRTRVSIYRMIKRGEIPCYRNGSILMFYKDEILSWVDSTKANNQ